MAWEPDYVTVDELADYVRVDDADDDVQLGLAISAASRAVDRATHRQFGLVAAPEERYYTAQYDRQCYRYTVDIDDVVIVTGFAVDADLGDDGTYTTSITSYDLKPANAITRDRPYTKILLRPDVSLTTNPDAVRVTARFGWADVPDTVRQATLLQASRFFTRRDAPFGVAGSPDQGSELRLLAKVDPDVQVMLGAYVRWWGAR